MEKQIPLALVACGQRAEEIAVAACAWDTGLLRNSITYALDGEKTAKGSYSSDDGKKTGKYSGQAQKESGKRRSVIIGTNVEYGIYVEKGTSRMKKQPFLVPAVKNHISDYRQILERYLKGEG